MLVSVDGMAPGGLRVRVLGGLTVEGLAERDVGSRKGRTVLKALAVARGRPVSRERLADIVWGDGAPARPGEQLAVLVSRLRGVLGADRVVRSDAGYSLRCDWLDLEELEARVQEAATALADGRVAAARAAAEAATSLARGEVLPEEDGEWLEAERAAAAALTATARRIAAEAAERAGDHTAAGAIAEQALAADRYDEAALRTVMRAHAAAGRPASALAAYARVRDLLGEDLGVPPAPETEALHDAIVLGRATSEAPVGAGPGARHAIVGRSRELGALTSALERVAATRRSSVVAIEGETGIGKSALVEAWTAGLVADTLVLTGRCDELGRDLPLQPIIDSLAPHVPRDVLGGTPAQPGGGNATVVVDTEVGRAALFARLADAVEQLAAGRPTVLVIDDLHLAGASTAAWIAFARRRIARLLVVTSSRPVEQRPVPAELVLALGPLDAGAVAELVGPARAAELHERSGGQPLLLAALRDSGPGELPASLAEAVERRLAALGTAARTLRTAAVLGSQVDLDLLSDVCRAPAVELLGDLEAAALGGLLVDTGGFRFRHELERVAISSSTGTTRRALIHRDAARALAARPASDPLAVAVHARLGGDVPLAVSAYVRAAGVSAERFDLPSAEEHLAAALALQRSPHALAARARVRVGLGRFEAAAADAAEAIGAGGGAPALEVAGWAAYYQRRYADALAYAEEGVDRASDDAIRASCLALGGRVLHGAGEVQQAVARLDQAMAVENAPGVRSLAAIWLGQVRMHEGRPDDSLALLRRALVHPDHLAHPFAPLHGRFTRVLALGQLGHLREALAACDELDGAVAGAGDAGSRFAGPAANCRAWLLRWSGLGRDADALNEAAAARSDPDGPRAEAYYAALLDLVDGRLLESDLDGAAALLDRLSGIEGWTGTMAWHQRHRWRLARARLALASGDRDAAEIAGAVAADAGARGARRYAALAIAVGALADRRCDVASLDETVAALDGCAALDGWPTVAALGETFGVARWREQARRRATALVADSPHPGATRAFAGRILP